MEITGIGGLIILIADIYAIVMILQSSEPVSYTHLRAHET